jgi:hypothetical protein
MKILPSVLFFLLLVFVLPVASYGALQWGNGWPESWHSADWSSARLLPAAEDEPDAIVHVMAARVGRWRGIFAHHSWIVIKPAGAPRYIRYDVVGWGNPVRTDHREADGRWYGNEPILLLSLRGQGAEAAIPAIRAAVSSYPYPKLGTYKAWPGPNSNTFVAYLASQVPELAPALLPTALGKDFRSDGIFAGLSPSRTGIQLSVFGLLGATVGWVEGVEINLFGLVAGLDVRRPAVKLPGWGRIGLGPA